MNKDRIEQGSGFTLISTSPDRPGSIFVKGRRLENPVKAVSTLPRVLVDLEPLAILASSEVDDSQDQDYINNLLGKIKTEYKGEQPEEVWRRSISRLAREGVTAGEIAESLMDLSERVKTSLNLGSLSVESRDTMALRIKSKILEYWPSKK